MNSSGEDEARQEQLREFLKQYKLDHYAATLIEEGFDRLLSLFDITETDLISLNVKRGHRRLLQRAIATARGVPISTPILINYGYDEPGTSHMPKPGTVTTTTTTTRFIPDDHTTRRSSPNTYYNNHHHVQKKRKQHVPSKPITAFDEFLNELKRDLSGTSIPEITSIAYDRWNSLTSTEKEKYEREALHANSDYVMDRFLFEDDNDRVRTGLG
ncbi:uncharacterized protein EV154DRAFT_558727 [Mucor mucedo]|uniref:uncharacterized protein n=1 Tax=Mucor mucedo TaxID=29922 RepID=UPI00221E8825|nr:uncharacterized protein EV154DRAFT_558727 [Mucor mucedo]KAI7896036.1 hypothetical protein EV154DRAFT_558727 [Mucor mucedo]